MKKYAFLLAFVGFMQSCSTLQEEVSVYLMWEMGKNQVENGVYESAFSIVNQGTKPLGENWTIYFNQAPAAVKMDANSPVCIEQISSTYYKMFPTKSYQGIAPKDTLKIIFRGEGSILKNSGAPEGAYIVVKDKNNNELPPKNVKITAKAFQNDFQWSRKDFAELPYPDGSYLYEKNKIFTKNIPLKQTDIFPSVKSSLKLGGDFSFTKDINIEYDAEFKNEFDLLKEKFAETYNCTF